MLGHKYNYKPVLRVCKLSERDAVHTQYSGAEPNVIPCRIQKSWVEILISLLSHYYVKRE